MSDASKAWTHAASHLWNRLQPKLSLQLEGGQLGQSMMKDGLYLADAQVIYVSFPMEEIL